MVAIMRRIRCRVEHRHVGVVPGVIKVNNSAVTIGVTIRFVAVIPHVMWGIFLTTMTIPKRLVKLVLGRDGGFCLLALPGCLGEASVADHRANRGMGGSKALNHPAALIAACGLCNGRKEEATGLVLIDLIERGLVVQKAATNMLTLDRCMSTPVTYLDGERFFLLADGSKQHERDCAPMRGD